MPVVVSRLINARRHLLALRIATLLGMGPEKVLALPRVSVKEHDGFVQFLCVCACKIGLQTYVVFPGPPIS